MITKKQKRSSRKMMANRNTIKQLNRLATNHLSNTTVASAVMPKQNSSGYAASIKRASGRGN